MKFFKATLLLAILFLFFQTTVASPNEIIIEDVETIWGPDLTTASNDVIDSTDAPSQNLSEASVSNADTFWSPDLITASSDITDSTDAPFPNLFEVCVSHADSVWNVNLTGEEFLKPDFWIKEIRPVQVVWKPDINDDGRIDLVAGKPTMVRVEVGMENYESLDKDTQLEIKLFLPSMVRMR